MTDMNYIAVDWGSTHLRAWHIENGVPINVLHLPFGVTRLEDATPEQIFERYINPWRSERLLPVYMAGMVGSDAGWKAAPYLRCPLKLNTLADSLTAVLPGVWIVPGLRFQTDDMCNVMRGEETLLLGVQHLSHASCVILPGTHSKCALTESGEVRRFDTAMTGELHHMLMHYSLLGRGLMAQEDSEVAFLSGLHRGMAQPALVETLFSVRASRLLGELAPEAVSEYLSGLLIGAETAVFTQRYRPARVALVADGPLKPRYRQALAVAGVEAETIAPELAFLTGIRSIHERQ